MDTPGRPLRPGEYSAYSGVGPGSENTLKLFEVPTQQIRPVNPEWISAAAARQLELTKPPGSLGRLEEIANRCAAIGETLELTAAHPRLVLFAADHGVCDEGVSAYPQEVTTQ